MDKKKSFLNVSVSMCFKIVLLILAIFTRRLLIQYIGESANGVNSLYLSIIGFLAIAELGVGTAITFAMYAPIVNGETSKVAALYQLFIKIYKIVGLIILVVGLLLTPFIPYFTKGYDADFNLYFTFILMLISVFISYMFSAKTSLINAYKNNYVTTTINSVGTILQHGLQVLVLILFKSFELYLVCRIISICLQWLVTELYSRKKYKEIISYEKVLVDPETKTEVVKKTKAMFMHKIGTLLVNTADSLIISIIIGVVVLGRYTNYTTIMTSMTGVISLFFAPLTSIVGQMCAKGDKNEEMKWFNFMYTFNLIVAIVFFLGYYAVIDDLVSLFFGASQEMVRSVPLIITINSFLNFMRQTTLLFRDATGTFYNDRWKPAFEGTLNVCLSIPFAFYFGVVGVLMSTIVTNVLICHIVEPHVLFKYGFKTSGKKYYIKNYIAMVVFVLLIVCIDIILVDFENIIYNILVNGCISLGISSIIVIIIFVINKDFREMIVRFLRRVLKKVS